MEISFCSDSRRPPANIPLVENDAEASGDVNSDENDGYYRSGDRLIHLSDRSEGQLSPATRVQQKVKVS